MLRVAALSFLLLTALLAGCAGDAKEDDVDERFGGLDATKDTGILRGVVVNDAIVPLAGAMVKAIGPDGNATTTTTGEEGTFGFGGLAPGVYVVTVSKLGYKPGEAAAEVKAGVDDPDIVKVTLLPDEATRPYAQQLHFEGYIECSGRFVVVGAAVCSIANIVVANATADRFSITYNLTRVPTFVQSEMVWQSTQAAGDAMSLRYSWDGGCGLLCDHLVRGKSPLVLQANQSVVDLIGLGSVNDLFLRVFNEPIEGTATGQCVDLPTPVLYWSRFCQGGVGLTVQQKFDVYTTVFYGYEPPLDWRFTDGQPVPPPPL